MTTKRVFRRSACLRYLICACISLKNKSRSFKDRFLPRWRRHFIASFFCLLSPCFTAPSCVFVSHTLNVWILQSVMIYTRLQLIILVASRNLAILSPFFLLFVCSFICDTETHCICDRSIDWSIGRVAIIVSEFRFFSSHASTINTSYAQTFDNIAHHVIFSHRTWHQRCYVRGNYFL